MKNLKINKYIVINLQFEGIHQWKNCNIEDVIFLKNPHRHIFHVELIKKVNHNDREIEIIMLKRKILDYIGLQPVNLENQSCEDIAENLYKYFNAYSVKVTEDGENGALIC